MPVFTSVQIRWVEPVSQYWGYIAENLGIDLTVVNPKVDPRWSFMTLDTDGKIRMDCSSPNAMASLIRNKDEYDIATGNDADADRHGIVTPDAGLMNPNAYLAVAIQYLYANRPGWRPDAGIGKTLVSSSMIDRVAASLGRTLVEVPVGFKWFVPGLRTGEIGFGGEESAGASFLAWTGAPGRPTRTASCSPSSPAKSRPSPASRQVSSTTSSLPSTGPPRMRVSTHPPIASRRPSSPSSMHLRLRPQNSPESRSLRS